MSHGENKTGKKVFGVCGEEDFSLRLGGQRQPYQRWHLMAGHGGSRL